MNKAAVLAILGVIVAGCAAREEVGRTSEQEYYEESGYQRPAEPNFPTGVPGSGTPESAPGGIR